MKMAEYDAISAEIERLSREVENVEGVKADLTGDGRTGDLVEAERMLFKPYPIKFVQLVRKQNGNSAAGTGDL